MGFSSQLVFIFAFHLVGALHGFRPILQSIGKPNLITTSAQISPSLETVDHAPIPADWKGDFLLNDPNPTREMESAEMLREWFPLSFETYLDPSIPNPILHMGRRLVVWKSAENGWTAQDDMCPHKLAPLSDGSITEEGNLRCSYHGWQFKDCGTCSVIPAQPKDSSIPSKCSVRSYPIRETGKLLWIWMDPSVEAVDNVRFYQKSWDLPNGYQREVAYSWDYLFENILDPTHVAYSHFGVGREFNRTEVDEIRDEHVTNLKAVYNNAGVQLEFNRTVNGNNRNETWDFMYPGIWFLRRGGSNKGGGGLIVGSPIDSKKTRIMMCQYNPDTTKQPETLKSKLMKYLKPLVTVLFHRGMDNFFNSDAFLIRYQQEMVAAGDTPLDPLKDYELMSQADQGTVAFRRWHKKRLGGRLPMAQALTPKSKSMKGSIAQPTTPVALDVTREEAADPWEQHTKFCPHCRKAHDIAKMVRNGSAASVVLAALFRPFLGTVASVAGSAALTLISLRAHKFVKSFHKKGHVHGRMG